MPYSSVSKEIPFSKVFLSDLRFLYASLLSFKSKSVLPIGYYSILLVCGIYIKGRIKLINFFWIIQFVSNCLSVYFIVYTLGRILRKYTILALLNQSFLLDESLHLISVLLQIFIIKFHIKQKDFIEKFSNS